MAYKEDSKKYKELVEKALDSYIADCPAPTGFTRAMAYSLEAGGKRLRPCMVLASCEMLGGNAEDALPLACALEMIHTYSLIHDDLPCMDNDDYRRGRLSNHKVFGEANAVLAGDGLLSYAFEIMLDGMKERLTSNYLAAVRAVACGAGVDGMISGQFVDLACETEVAAGEEELCYIQSKKTAAMIKAALLAGANAAGASKEQLDALAIFGEEYGRLFQMTDDILDIEGTFENMGKTLGKDISENKLTYPALKGLDKAKQIAAKTADKAIAALNIFGERAAYFTELTALTVSRKS